MVENAEDKDDEEYIYFEYTNTTKNCVNWGYTARDIQIFPLFLEHTPYIQSFRETYMCEKFLKQAMVAVKRIMEKVEEMPVR